MVSVVQSAANLVVSAARRLQVSWAAETSGREHIPDVEALHYAFESWCATPKSPEHDKLIAGLIRDDVRCELRSQIARMGSGYVIGACLAGELVKAAESALGDFPLAEHLVGVITYLKNGSVSDALMHLRRKEVGFGPLAPYVSKLDQYLLDTQLALSAGCVEQYWQGANSRRGDGKLWEGLVDEQGWRMRSDRFMRQMGLEAIQAGVSGMSANRVVIDEFEVIECGGDAAFGAPELTVNAIMGKEKYWRFYVADYSQQQMVESVGKVIRNKAPEALELLNTYFSERFDGAVNAESLCDSVALYQVCTQELGCDFVELALDAYRVRMSANLAASPAKTIDFGV